MLTTEKLLDHIKKNIDFQRQQDDVIKTHNVPNNTAEIKSDKSMKQLKNVSKFQVLNIFNDDVFNGMFNDYNNQLVRFGSIVCEDDCDDSDDDSDNEENLSLVSSLLTIIKPKYKSLTAEQQLHNIRKLNEKFVHDFNSQNIFTYFDYSKYGWTKQTVFNDIKNHVNNKIVLKFMSDYFCVNLWILFHDTNEIYMSYANNKCNTYRKNIIMFYDSETQIYEPISKIDMTTFIFEHDDDIILHLFNNINDVFPINVDFKKHAMDFSDMNTDDLNHYSHINKPKIKKSNYGNNIDKQYNDIVEKQNDDIVEQKNNDINMMDQYDNKKEDIILPKENNKKLFTKKNVNVEYDDNELNETITDNKEQLNPKYNDDKIIKCKQSKNICVSNKMKLIELQQFAKNIGLSITVTVNGKSKNKTKEILVREISEKQSK